MDSTELVAPGAAWMFGYFPEATIASEGGLVIGRSNVPEQGSNFEAFADEWGIAPCASAGIDYWHYGGSMDFPGNWAVQCRQTEVWLDFPEGAWDTRIWLSPVDSALLHMRHSAATSWAPTFISESPSLYAQFPMGDDPGRVSFLAEPSAAPGYAHDPTNRWKIRAARFMTDGPVDGECPEPTSWTPQRPACAAQGCDEP